MEGASLLAQLVKSQGRGHRCDPWSGRFRKEQLSPRAMITDACASRNSGYATREASAMRRLHTASAEEPLLSAHNWGGAPPLCTQLGRSHSSLHTAGEEPLLSTHNWKEPLLSAHNWGGAPPFCTQLERSPSSLHTAHGEKPLLSATREKPTHQ